jgi:hypothetical protein
MSIKSLKIRRSLRKYAPGGAVGEPTKFDSAVQKTGQVTGLIGTIRSAVNQLAEPIRANAEEVDPNTGELLNQGKAERLGTFGAQLDPMRAASDTFKDPGATGKEKWAAGINLVVPNPFASNYLSKRKYERMEKENQAQIYKNKMQTWGGPSENPYTMMPYGGKVRSEVVELEQGEPYMTPDGNLETISTQAPTHAQGGVPIELPVGTKVLGKKMAFKDKQFKQLGRQLVKAQKKYDEALDNNPTGLTANTAKRMLQNTQTAFNKLFQAQGVDTASTQQYAKGGKISVNDPDMVMDVKTRPYTERTGYQEFIHPETGKPFRAVRPTTKNLNNPDVFEVSPNVYGTYKPYLEGSNKWDIDYEPSIKRTYGDVKGDVKFFEPTGYEEYGKGGWIQKAVNPAHKGYCTPMTKSTCTPKRKAFAMTMKKHHGFRKGADGLMVGSDYFKQNPNQLRDFQSLYGLEADNIYGPNTEEAWNKYGQAYINNAGLKPLQSKSSYIPNITEEGTQPQYSNITQSNISDNGNQGSSYNPKNAIYNIGALAPVLYYIGQGLRKGEQLNPRDYLNPYSNEVRQAMRNRRYDINPELEQINLESATNYRRLKESGLNPSQYMGGMQMGSINKMRANASALARKQAVDSGYIADQAQTDLGIGRDIAQTKLSIKDINDRNAAARRNYMAAGMTQLGQFAQIKQQENNMMIRDAQKLGLLSALVQNFAMDENGEWKFKQTGETVTKEQIMNYIKGGK